MVESAASGAISESNFSGAPAAKTAGATSGQDRGRYQSEAIGRWKRLPHHCLESDFAQLLNRQRSFEVQFAQELLHVLGEHVALQVEARAGTFGAREGADQSSTDKPARYPARVVLR